MNDNFQVSVIIPLYNCEKYIGEAIDSILGQTFNPYEILVIDDGSTDRSFEIANSFNPPVRVISKPNGGTASALNRGISEAQSQYLAFLDADDLWRKDKLEKQVNKMKEDPELDCVFGYVHQFHSPELSLQARQMIECPTEPQEGIVAPAMLIKKDAMMRVGLLNESFIEAEFIEWYSRAREHELKIHLLEDIVLDRRLHLDNKSRRLREDKYKAILKISKGIINRHRKGS
jgi:glycosyltransferase involved in cell wall biosynthesis